MWARPRDAVVKTTVGALVRPLIAEGERHWAEDMVGMIFKTEGEWAWIMWSNTLHAVRRVDSLEVIELAQRSDLTVAGEITEEFISRE